MIERLKTSKIEYFGSIKYFGGKNDYVDDGKSPLTMKLSIQ